MLNGRVERSIALAKEVAETLEVDLFDDRRRGRFRDIVQNCLICAYQPNCANQVTGSGKINLPLQHCRNRDFFSQGE